MPIEGVDGNATKEEILLMLKKYGIFEQDDTVKIEIWGSGKPMHEFLWSEDMADACAFLMEKRNFTDCYNTLNEEIRNTHINIGKGKDISIRELALLIKSMVGFSCNLYFNTDKPDGTMKKLTDVSKLNELGWRHTVDLKEITKNIYNWYTSNSNF